MRGGILHNDVLVAAVEDLLLACGARTAREVSVRGDRIRGAIDLVGWMPDSLVVAVEAELTPKRITRDIAKAEALGCDLLCIVTPTPAVARACVRRIPRDPNGKKPEILVHPLDPMLARLADRFSLNPAAE